MSMVVLSLNESPSEKEGKFSGIDSSREASKPSMKVPPKRKGNFAADMRRLHPETALNESPSEKEGKCRTAAPRQGPHSLNESPSEKEGKCELLAEILHLPLHPQ